MINSAQIRGWGEETKNSVRHVERRLYGGGENQSYINKKTHRRVKSNGTPLLVFKVWKALALRAMNPARQKTLGGSVRTERRLRTIQSTIRGGDNHLVLTPSMTITRARKEELMLGGGDQYPYVRTRKSYELA